MRASNSVSGEAWFPATALEVPWPCGPERQNGFPELLEADLRITGEAFENFFFFLRIGGEGKELSVCACVYSRITLCVHVCMPACGLVVLLLLSETPRPVLPFFWHI